MMMMMMMMMIANFEGSVAEFLQILRKSEVKDCLIGNLRARPFLYLWLRMCEEPG